MRPYSGRTAPATPLTSVTPMRLPLRDDKVTAGGDPEKVLKNAPVREGDFFVVPKVVE